MRPAGRTFDIPALKKAGNFCSFLATFRFRKSLQSNVSFLFTKPQFLTSTIIAVQAGGGGATTLDKFIAPLVLQKPDTITLFKKHHKGFFLTGDQKKFLLVILLTIICPLKPAKKYGSLFHVPQTYNMVINGPIKFFKDFIIDKKF